MHDLPKAEYMCLAMDSDRDEATLKAWFDRWAQDGWALVTVIQRHGRAPLAVFVKNIDLLHMFEIDGREVVCPVRNVHVYNMEGTSGQKVGPIAEWKSSSYERSDLATAGVLAFFLGAVLSAAAVAWLGS